MCDRCSLEHGYICDECFGELIASGSTTNIATFMDGEKSPDLSREAFDRYDAAFPCICTDDCPHHGLVDKDDGEYKCPDCGDMVIVQEG